MTTATVIRLLVAIALPAGAAHAVVTRFWAAREGDLAGGVLRAGVALPLGAGAASLLAFGWLVAGGSLGRVYAVTDFVLWGAVLAAARWRTARRDATRIGRPSPRDWAAAAVAVLVLAMLVAAFVQITVMHPHGQWDAWSIWNLRARFLFRAGEQWGTAFAPELSFSHPGYPLLVPAAVARLWAYSGETIAAPAAMAAVFTFAPAMVVFGAAAQRAGWLAGATAALLVVAAPTWVAWGAAQYADVPVACLLVAAVAAVLAASRGAAMEARRGYALAGALLGLCAWTKDEGLVLAAVFGAWAVLSPRAGSVRERAIGVAAGAAIPLAVRAAFQLMLAPVFAEVFTTGQSVLDLARRLLAPERWKVILAVAPQHVPGAEVWLPVLAVVAAAALGARWRELRVSSAVPAVVSAAAFLLVYGVTPIDLRWHLENSASRILLQPWPAFVLGVFWLIPQVPAPLVAAAEAPSGLAIAPQFGGAAPRSQD